MLADAADSTTLESNNVSRILAVDTLLYKWTCVVEVVYTSYILPAFSTDSSSVPCSPFMAARRMNGSPATGMLRARYKKENETAVLYISESHISSRTKPRNKRSPGSLSNA